MNIKSSDLSAHSNDVVVTGMGVVSPFGHDIESFKEKMFSGESGIKEIRGSLVSENFPISFAGKVPPQVLDDLELSSSMKTNSELSNSSLFALLATDNALKMSLPASASGFEVDAILYGSAEGIAYDLVKKSLSSSLSATDWNESSAEAPLESIAEYLWFKHGLKVPEHRLICVNSACASGNQAIGEAMERIRAGEWTRAIVGGVDSRCNAPNLMNFNMLGALCTEEAAAETASKPFDAKRSGFVRSEGAATLVLETREAAERRGAKILGVISGYATSSDAYRLTDGRDDGAGVMQAMTDAVTSSKLSPADISAVSAHGTSTPLNDRLEAMAINHVFKEYGQTIPVTSLKSQLGHSTVAAGAIEAISCLLMLNEQRLAPTINYETPDPECNVNVVAKTRDYDLKHILSNNFGFGGQNTCLVISGA